MGFGGGGGSLAVTKNNEKINKLCTLAGQD